MHCQTLLLMQDALQTGGQSAVWQFLPLLFTYCVRHMTTKALASATATQQFSYNTNIEGCSNNAHCAMLAMSRLMEVAMSLISKDGQLSIELLQQQFLQVQSHTQEGTN